MPSEPAPTFELLRRQAIASLNITVEEYVHKPTGAQHIHIAADNDENVFLVALRTVPHDSTGVAHILEHTALCGSEKYPARDPFFMMIRRSLNTFMNAMTSSDWTAYPFASQNRKDFNNLLGVYLDAVFFSRLDPMDFAQEGHRLEFEKGEDPDSPLVYKGVVFNEMKGAMSSVPAQLWQTLCTYLYPTTTYHYNSGGDPACITDLTYEQLLNFYRSHYHPSNAIFMTFGDIPAAEHQTKFEAQALHRFEKLPATIAVPPEKRYYAPVRVEEYYPYNDSEDIAEKTHIVMGWLLGKSTDLYAVLQAHLLTGVLFDNSASPLQHALETTDLGSAPSPLCGLDDSQYELVFVCGLEGSEPERADAFEQLVLDTLEKVATDGVPLDDVEAALHQLELQQREIGGDGFPYGLQLILTALTSATHRGDPIGLLDLDPVIDRLRQEIQDPEYIKNLCRSLLLDNQHRVRLVMRPDTQLAERRADAEREHLAAIKARLSNEESRAIIERAKALEARQQYQDDDSILPKVGLEDIPAQMRHIEGRHDNSPLPVSLYDAGTNGLSYQHLVLNLPELSADELSLLPVYTTCLTELGLGEVDYLEAQKRQDRVVGSIHAFSSIRGQAQDAQQSLGHLVISAKALSKNYAAMTALQSDTLHRIRFDEGNRLRELVAQLRARREQSVPGSGHVFAMTAACTGMSPSAQLQQQVGGLLGIRTVKSLDQQLKDAGELDKLLARLQALHERVRQQPPQFLLVSEEATLEHHHQTLCNTWPAPAKIIEPLSGGELALPGVKAQTVREAWITGAQVNFCAKAYPTVPLTHPDAAPLTVLGGYLRNGYLHRAIREQGGAYGAGAQQDASIAAFRFFTYRDPRLEESLNDFDRAIDWLLTTEHEWQPVEEAILGVISSLDKPGSPAGEAKQAFHAELQGRTYELRQAFRERVLAVTAGDLKRVAEHYLKPEQANIAVVTGPANRARVEKLGLETQVL